MNRIVFILGLGLVACGPQDTDLDTPKGDKVVTFGDCSAEVGEWETMTDIETLNVTGEMNSDDPFIARVIHTQEEMTAFEAETGWVVAEVDLGFYSVMLSSVHVSSTCGMSEPVVTVWVDVPEINGSEGTDEVGHIRMNFDISDSSGNCDEVCDMTWTEIVAIKVPGPHTDPFNKEYSICVTRTDTCSDAS